MASTKKVWPPSRLPIDEEMPPPEFPSASFDWVAALEKMSPAELTDLIGQATDTLETRKASMATDLAARFRAQAAEAGVDWEAIARLLPAPTPPSPGARGKAKAHGDPADRKGRPIVPLPPDAEGQIVNLLKANEGRVPMRKIFFLIFEGRPTHAIATKSSNALHALMQDMIDRKVITMLADHAGPGTQRIYGLASMQEDG
jgi:hypothetical protein